MGWVGNVFIVIGLYFIGEKKRWAFLFSVVGELIWCLFSLYKQQYDLAFICAVFCALALRSWIKWR